ncbi:hypothetical protein DC74_973 [Streptomyces noursei]|nr:hypothetical protein DC74_973 [Streptomyces noursei]
MTLAEVWWLFETVQYRHRSTAERCVSEWKQHRAVAGRHDKRDYVFNGTLAVAEIVDKRARHHQALMTLACLRLWLP